MPDVHFILGRSIFIKDILQQLICAGLTVSHRVPDRNGELIFLGDCDDLESSTLDLYIFDSPPDDVKVDVDVVISDTDGKPRRFIKERYGSQRLRLFFDDRAVILNYDTVGIGEISYHSFTYNILDNTKIRVSRRLLGQYEKVRRALRSSCRLVKFGVEPKRVWVDGSVKLDIDRSTWFAPKLA